MKKIIFTVALMLFSICIHANTPDVSSYFQGKTGCFILYDLTKNAQVTEYNAEQCAKRMPPQSTFKIALSLMAFDQKLITQDTVFKWDGQDRGIPQWKWNQDQTPKTWLSNSVVWVSQQITPQLGMDKIKYYLRQFNYGNQDFSGDPGKSNGLTQAWLVSSLKISAEEQLTFLKALVKNQLPISSQALNNTQENMYIEESPKGWKLYGKTGSSSAMPAIGWFVGYIQKSGQSYIFITNLVDKEKNPKVSGVAAKEITKQILIAMGVY